MEILSVKKAREWNSLYDWTLLCPGSSNIMVSRKGRGDFKHPNDFLSTCSWVGFHRRVGWSRQSRLLTRLGNPKYRLLGRIPPLVVIAFIHLWAATPFHFMEDHHFAYLLSRDSYLRIGGKCQPSKDSSLADILPSWIFNPSAIPLVYISERTHPTLDENLRQVEF